ncbi:hypothetical protein H257_10977 [Aphanomyces astaci]|uniref:No apical meristem-associated C-terminal domain-containing protein n=1 Tax=Aphanomyces astaci TaxID=112090 RepID=W4G514_APHAT|nr:hypothetical protein H257_10977 [Aphanomyces astaci]ETV74386.1 hypothetical protein H257_10977 [Aphanomyces astaci]|eukprot:XP_009836044.1 hypothetical protein H257_10977 [Aphanomyces astaci]
MADADEYFKAQKWNKKQTPFKLVHCWEILKDQPKWQRASNVASDGPGMAAVPSSVLTAPSAIALAQEKRPIGSKRAKLAQLVQACVSVWRGSLMVKGDGIKEIEEGARVQFPGSVH